MEIFNRRIDLRFYALALILCFPILKYNIVSISIGIFAVTSLGTFISLKERFQKEYTKYFLVSASFMLLLILTLVHSDNLENGLKNVQHGLSIIIFPLLILFFNERINAQKLEKLLYIFIGSCFICSIYIYIELFYNEAFKDTYEGIKFWHHPYRDTLFNLKYLDLHPSYFSMWILFSAIILVKKLLEKTAISTSFFLLLLIAFFVFTAILFSARAPLAGFVVAVFFLLIFKIKSMVIRGATFLFFLLMITISITQISLLKSRFLDEFNAQIFKPPVGSAHTSTNIRVGIYQCTGEIFSKNVLFGVGVGDVMDQLNLCYKQFHTRVYEETNYNTHSSYFNLLLSGGIFAMILFLLALFYQIRLAVVSQNHLYLSFLILMMICLLFENVFSRMHGALFYGLFNAIFIKQILSEIKNING